MMEEQLTLPLDGEGEPGSEQQQEPPELQEEEEKLNEYGYTETEWNAPVFGPESPTRREVEEWKEKHTKGVYFTPFDSEVYIWRVLEREEYKVFINNRELTTMDREEEITARCVLYPRNLTREKMRTDKAGVPSLLSEMIMDKSGFVAQSAPIKL